MDGTVSTFDFHLVVELNYSEFAGLFHRTTDRIEKRLFKKWTLVYYRNAWRFIPILLAFTASLVLDFQGWSYTALFFLLLGGLFGVFGLFFPYWGRRRYFHAIPDKNLLSVADSEGAAVTFNGVTKATTWAHVADVDADAYGIYLWSWTDDVFFFPRRGFDSAKEAQAFVDFVRERSHVARPS